MATIKDVQPIRSKEDLDNMKWSLKRHCSERDYILFLLGINSGLRVRDLLELKVKQVSGKNEITVREGKTKKVRKIHLKQIKEELNDYLRTLYDTEWLFPSRKGDKPISRIQAYRQLNKAAEMADITSGIWNTHDAKNVWILALQGI